VIRFSPAPPELAHPPLQQAAGYAGVCFAEAGLRSTVVAKDGPLGRGEIQ
jgi:hypothetical protein